MAEYNLSIDKYIYILIYSIIYILIYKFTDNYINSNY